MMMSLMSPTRMTALAGTTYSEPGPQVDFLEGQLEKFACRAAGLSVPEEHSMEIRASAHLAGF